MAEHIRAFSIPLAPAYPGLNDWQLEKRKEEAEKIVRAAMPFAASLRDSQLIRGLESENGFLWRTFSLVENPQLLIDFDAQGNRRKQTPSAAQRMHKELEKLREEAEATIIRVGELEKLSASLSEVATDQALQALEDLPAHDQALWHLVHSKRGKRISISFQGRDFGISMPMFPVHIPEDRVRHIRFRITSVNRKSAEVTDIRSLAEDKTGLGLNRSQLKNITQLKRSPSESNAEIDNWFCLYGAEYRNHCVEASVRVAVSTLDFSPSHLELVCIGNQAELVQLVTGAIPKRIKD